VTLRDPFLITGPAVISFSGGRTSGYMLRRILNSHGGHLPDDVIVCFANTGKEDPLTLDFVHECSRRWHVNVTWLEYRYRGGDQHGFAIVDHATASRNGEPFEAAIEHRSFLPNPVARFCTVELKVRTMHRYLRSLGWTEWDSIVGIRADEQRRVAKLKNQDYGKHEERFAPLAEAGITAADVGRFWREQPFDLQLPNNNGKTMHGNCDLCFLKGGDQVLSLIREKPSRAVWWMEQETKLQSSGRLEQQVRRDAAGDARGGADARRGALGGDADGVDAGRPAAPLLGV
jgi:3'-phosphoadenosine 5'-phosphosulfate sulfotransferase (PAPS reductase)/FAD synthetase